MEKQIPPAEKSTIETKQTVEAKPEKWKLTIEEFSFMGCHHNGGGTD